MIPTIIIVALGVLFFFICVADKGHKSTIDPIELERLDGNPIAEGVGRLVTRVTNRLAPQVG